MFLLGGACSKTQAPDHTQLYEEIRHVNRMEKWDFTRRQTGCAYHTLGVRQVSVTVMGGDKTVKFARISGLSPSAPLRDGFMSFTKIRKDPIKTP